MNFASTRNSGSLFLSFKLRFGFSPQNLQIPESHENPKSQRQRWPQEYSPYLKKDSSRKIDAEGANESIRSEKSHVFISKFCFFSYESGQIPSSPGRNSERPAEIPNVRPESRTFGRNPKKGASVPPFSRPWGRQEPRVTQSQEPGYIYIYIYIYR